MLRREIDELLNIVYRYCVSSFVDSTKLVAQQDKFAIKMSRCANEHSLRLFQTFFYIFSLNLGNKSSLTQHSHVQVFSARRIPLLPNNSPLALPVLYSQNWFIALELEAQVKFLNGNKGSLTQRTYKFCFAKLEAQVRPIFGKKQIFTCAPEF